MDAGRWRDDNRPVDAEGGVRPSAIRYYEARGILRHPARSSNAYRLYDSEAVALLLFMTDATTLGFSLGEIRQLIASSQNEPPCALCRELIERHLVTIDVELRRPLSLRHSLKGLLRRPVSQQATDEICPLIQSSQTADAMPFSD